MAIQWQVFSIFIVELPLMAMNWQFIYYSVQVMATNGRNLKMLRVNPRSCVNELVMLRELLSGDQWAL